MTGAFRGVIDAVTHMMRATGANMPEYDSATGGDGIEREYARN